MRIGIKTNTLDAPKDLLFEKLPPAFLQATFEILRLKSKLPCRLGVEMESLLFRNTDPQFARFLRGEKFAKLIMHISLLIYNMKAT